MTLPFAPLLATSPFSWLLDPIVAFMRVVLTSIDGVVHSFGLSLVLLALAVKVVFYPLTVFQYKSMRKSQALMPRMKAIQAKYKGQPEKLNAEMMALYKETGTNPLAGCIPLLVQYPVIISLYYTIVQDKEAFAKSTFLWIGSPIAAAIPNHLLAMNLAQLDYLLLALYAISMYVTVRFTTPAADEQTAQQQKIMAFISPVMIAIFAVKYQWYSALLVYWLSFNVFGIFQQLYMNRTYKPAVVAAGSGDATVAIKDKGENGSGKNVAAVVAKSPSAAPRPNGSKRRRARR